MLPQNRVAARFFGLVEQPIGGFDQVTDTVVIPFGNATADGQINHVVIKKGVLNADPDPFGHLVAFVEGRVRHYNQKLFTAIAAQKIGLAEVIADDPDGFHQHLIASLMAKAVIDGFSDPDP